MGHLQVTMCKFCGKAERNRQPAFLSEQVTPLIRGSLLSYRGCDQRVAAVAGGWLVWPEGGLVWLEGGRCVQRVAGVIYTARCTAPHGAH